MAESLVGWQQWQQRLAQSGYIASDSLAMSLYLSQLLERPLLLEGAAGVGKTEVAKMLAQCQGCRLIRLQCYQGLDASAAIYEWNYQRQLLSLRASSAEDKERSSQEIEARLFSEDYLLQRPLLQSITQNQSPVLLIDEVDRADEEFEAYLLELLSDFQVTIPELGTIHAISKPQVILTSNGTRELSDALRRRCLYNYVDYPDLATELQILKARLPEIDTVLALQIVGFVQTLRKEDLEKNPGVAEMLDWAAALSGLGLASLNEDSQALQATLVCLLKTETDQAQIPAAVAQRIAGTVIQ